MRRKVKLLRQLRGGHSGSSLRISFNPKGNPSACLSGSACTIVGDDMVLENLELTYPPCAPVCDTSLLVVICHDFDYPAGALEA